MDTRWFLVANQRSARVFVKAPSRLRVRQIAEFENPLDGVTRRDLVRKEAGRGVRSVGRIGSVHYSAKKRHDPLDEAAKQFAKEIAKHLAKEFREKKFGALTIAAEPGFMGKIRLELNAQVESHVDRWIKKDLGKTSKLELSEFLLAE